MVYKSYLIGACTLLLCSCSTDSVKTDASVTNNSSNNTIQVKEDVPPALEKSTEDLLLAAFETGKNIFKTLKRNDSISAINRERIVAYQIGLPVNDVDVVFDVFEKLENKDNFYVLKKHRKEYYIIYYNGLSEKELNDSLENFKSKLPLELAQKLKVTNLMAICPKREKLIQSENISKRKRDFELPCLICDK